MIDDPMACHRALNLAGMTIPIVAALAFVFGILVGSRL